MAIPLSDNILTDAPKPSDARYGPWGSVAEACAGVPVSRRYLGLTVGILVNGIAQDYAWTIDLTNGKLLPKSVGGGSAPAGPSGFEIRSYAANRVLLHVPAGITPDKMRVNLVPKAPKPTGYDTPLDASEPTASGINFTPAGSQTLEINELATVTGATRPFDLVDSSDGSTSQADVDISYEGQYFRFTRANGSAIEATWPATPQTIML